MEILRLFPVDLLRGFPLLAKHQEISDKNSFVAQLIATCNSTIFATDLNMITIHEIGLFVSQEISLHRAYEEWAHLDCAR